MKMLFWIFFTIVSLGLAGCNLTEWAETQRTFDLTMSLIWGFNTILGAINVGLNLD